MTQAAVKNGGDDGDTGNVPRILGLNRHIDMHFCQNY